MASIMGAVSCTTSLTNQGRRVRSASASEVDGCKFLGVFQGTSTLGGEMREKGQENALNELRNKAAEKGATHLVVKVARGTYSGGFAEGDGYRCRNRTASDGSKESESDEEDDDDEDHATVSDAPKTEPELLGSGTCFAVSPDGLVATANHVVDGALRIFVRFEGEEVAAAKVFALRPASDIAILKIERATPTYLPLALDAPVRGAKLFVIGYPKPGDLGLEPKYVDGTLATTMEKSVPKLIQLNMAIHGGHSGAAVVEEDLGFAVGVVSFEALKFADSEEAQNVGFAIHSEEVASLLGREIDLLPKPSDRDATIRRAESATCLVVVAQ